MRINKRAILACVGAVSALGVAAGPAMATSPPALNHKTQYLTSAPYAGEAVSCVSRDIYLATGTYQWHLTATNVPTTNRTTYLASGTYAWTDCLTPMNGFYEHDSYLTPPSGATAKNSNNTTLVYDGTYTWGSVLIPPS